MDGVRPGAGVGLLNSRQQSAVTGEVGRATSIADVVGEVPILEHSSGVDRESVDRLGGHQRQRGGATIPEDYQVAQCIPI